MSVARAPFLGALVLAGGRAARVDGAVKPLFEVGGITLLAAVVDAARHAGADAPVVVAPVLDPALPVRWVQEDAPFGGPAAAVVAGLAAIDVDPEWMLVLAADLVNPQAAVSRLVDDLALLPADTDGICLGDAGSRPQWLTAAYRTAALRRAAAAVTDPRGAAMRTLLEDLAIAVVRVGDDLVADVDTWQDLERARRTASGQEQT